MKWIKHTSIFFLFLLFIVSACNREDCPVPAYPVEGLWVGKYGSADAAPTFGYSMAVEADGKLILAAGSNLTENSRALGTWTLTGNTFKATYTYEEGGTYSIQATWNNKGKMSEGTWGYETDVSNGGTWYMDRVN